MLRMSSICYWEIRKRLNQDSQDSRIFRRNILTNLQKISTFTLVFHLNGENCMKSNLKKITLAASFGLALAFTISCSSDDDKGEKWLTCGEFETLQNSCAYKYEPEFNNCGDDDAACDARVQEKFDKCVIDGACNGLGMADCRAHYKKEGCTQN